MYLWGKCGLTYITTHPSVVQFKSFVNTAFKPTMYSPHRASFHVKGNATSRSQLVDENENPISHGRNKNSSHSVASVYHYATKSKEVGRHRKKVLNCYRPCELTWMELRPFRRPLCQSDSVGLLWHVTPVLPLRNPSMFHPHRISWRRSAAAAGQESRDLKAIVSVSTRRAQSNATRHRHCTLGSVAAVSAAAAAVLARKRPLWQQEI